MGKVVQLYKVSVELNKLLEKEMKKSDRESNIEHINQLIDKRQALMDQLSPPYTVEEKELGQKVIELNQQITLKLDRLFTELKFVIRNLKKQKSSNEKYVNPYQNASNYDGMFLDKKK